MSDYLPPSRTMTDVLSLPDDERNLVNWIMRQSGATLAQCVAKFPQPAAEIEERICDLIKAGFLRQTESADDECVYQPAMRTRRNRQVPKQIWDALS
ncbi:MAG: hypothetical protein AAF703_06485 [Cyanobacteria bacterium P01_D01_bin.105]